MHQGSNVRFPPHFPCGTIVRYLLGFATQMWARRAVPCGAVIFLQIHMLSAGAAKVFGLFRGQVLQTNTRISPTMGPFGLAAARPSSPPSQPLACAAGTRPRSASRAPSHQHLGRSAAACAPSAEGASMNLV